MPDPSDDMTTSLEVISKFVAKKFSLSRERKQFRMLRPQPTQVNPPRGNFPDKIIYATLAEALDTTNRSNVVSKLDGKALTERF